MTARSRPEAAGNPLSVVLPAQARGERLDRALAAILRDESRASLQRLIPDGRVRLAGGPVRSSYTVRGGETVEVDLPAPRPSTLLPEDLPIRVVHEDDDLLVIDKEPGLSVHPGAGARGG